MSKAMEAAITDKQLQQVVVALQKELARYQERVHAYYCEEVIPRGDKIMMREYCKHFGIE